MARNDDGEFELVLGNRQLISVFLIVVVLLGVFFSMGYIVGRNSGAGTVTTAKQITVEHPPTVAPQPAESTEPPAESKPTPTGPPATHPVTTAAVKPAPATPPPATIAKEPPKEQRPPATGRAVVTGEPAAGQYWQVVATSRPDAELVAEALARKGFHSSVSPGPREGIFRVLVGPAKDASALAQSRADLEASGFKNPIKRTY